MSDSHKQSDVVLAFAQDLANIMQIATRLVEIGRRIDLTGLDGQIGLLCAKTLDLPPDEGRLLRPRLMALHRAAETLSRCLTDQAEQRQEAEAWIPARPRS